MDQTESDNKDDSEEESDSEIVSYQVPPSQHQKGEASFSDDDEGDASILENTGSVFGFGESKFETSIDNVKPHVERSMIASSTKRPVINAHQIISDIQIQSSIYAESVVTRSLEMMWFVMVAAEDVRPKKIAIRSYVKEVLAQGLSNICILKEISQEFVVNCLWEGYDKATHSIVANHLQMARQSVSISCVNRSLQIAQSITINNHLEAEKRYIGMKRILIHDISFNLISNIISQQVKVTSIRKSTSCKFIENILTNSIQNILENLEPVMCSYERFHEIVEELTIGCIGAAVYTVEMKVIPTRNVIKNVQNNKNIHGTIGALPVGTGFALAKAKKTAKDIIELEIYNMQTKETITHLYHSNNGEYASINDAIHDVTKSLDGINPLLFEETTLLYQTDMNIDGRSYNMKLIKHETLYLTLLELHDIRMKTNLKIQLTKKQEKEIEYVRDITEYIQQLFQQSVLFIGYSSLKEAMIQKSGNNILIASDILLNEKKKPEIILQIEEILINYQPYNIKVTEDEIGIRIEVWNISIGKVTSTRLTKRQERDFQITNDRQQFIVNLLNTPGFAFLL